MVLLVILDDWVKYGQTELTRSNNDLTEPNINKYMVNSFVTYMRPLIIIDAAHLKGKFPGTNIVIVGMDGNNQIIPIATGVAQSETNKSWCWFLSKLKECIGDNPNLTIISDRHHAITHACKTVFPNAFHGYCCRHLMVNCNMGTDKLNGLYWKTCKAYTVQEFGRLINVIRDKAPDSHRKLMDAGFCKWSRALCPTTRYNYMTSNSVESINALSKDDRKLPITMLMNWFTSLVQKWYYERRAKYEDKPDDELTDWATAKIKRRMLKSVNWTVVGANKNKLYEVREISKTHVVDIQKAECTCRKWQLSGLPCGHVCAMARFANLHSVVQLAKPWFLNRNLKGTYAGIIYPMRDVSTWVTPSELEPLLPPMLGQTMPGRPRKKDRIPSKNEGKIIRKCGRCGMKGHTRASCNQPLPKAPGFKRLKSSNDQPYANSQSQEAMTIPSSSSPRLDSLSQWSTPYNFLC